MARNLFSSYGRVAQIMPGGAASKTFYVCPSASTNMQDLQQMFPVDEDGLIRVYGTIQGACNAVANNRGDVVMVMPGSYDETVTISHALGGFTIMGLGGLGDTGIAATTAGARGMTNNANDVTLINLGVAGDDTADYALFNTGSRFRTINCKIEGAVKAFGTGPGTVAQVAALTTGNSGDVNLYNTEFCWGTDGVNLVASDYGVPTQVYLENCRFHNLSGTEILQVPGAFGLGCVRNLMVKDCLFEAMEDGTNPSDYVNVAGAADTGIFTGNRFAIATNAIADLKIGANIMWVANATEAGWSAARPA